MGTVVRVKPIIYFAKHELYNMGHLLTAASVHYRVTGQENFLDIARKLGDYLLDLFGPMPPELAHFGFNPSNTMGAVDLYRATGDPNYLELGRVLLRCAVPNLVVRIKINN